MSTSSTHMNDDTPQGSELQRMFADSAERLLSENVTKAQIERVERGTWPDDLWKLATDGGFTLTTVPEAAGGVGGTWADAAFPRPTAPASAARPLTAVVRPSGVQWRTISNADDSSTAVDRRGTALSLTS